MDTRREHGQYWPGKRTDVGPAPTPADNGKVDRVDLGTLPADATASEMRTAIRNIQNAIRPLATALAAALCGFAMAQTAAWDNLRGGVHVVTNEQDAAAMARIVSATNDIAVKMSGLRSDNAAAIAASTNGIPEAIADHGTRIGALEEAAADRPDMSLYALRSEVPPAVDLEPYATTTDMVDRVAAAAEQTGLQLESLRTEMDGKVEAATNGIPAAIAAATNGIPAQIAAATNGIPEAIASATNGIPARIAAATNALDKSLAPAIATTSNALAQATTDLAQKVEGLAMAFAASNTATRLATQDGSIYQDATGVVWRAENFEVPGLFSLKKIEYYTNGVYQAETNAPAGISWAMWEGYDNATWEILAGESGMAEDAEERYATWLEFTNHVAAADMEDINKFYYVAQLDVAGEEIELTATGEIYARYVTIEWPMSNTNVERYLVFERTNVTATIRTPIDRVMYESEKEKFISTNDVCAIVTNEVENGFTKWTIYRDDVDITSQVRQPTWGEYPPEGTGWMIVDSMIDSSFGTIAWADPAGTGFATEDATVMYWDGEDADYNVVSYHATRTSITRNALGLARLVDLPPLTNGLASASFVAAATNALLTSLAPTIFTSAEWTGATNRIAALEQLLQGIESALHLVNTGTNIVTEANQ